MLRPLGLLTSIDYFIELVAFLAWLLGSAPSCTENVTISPDLRSDL